MLFFLSKEISAERKLLYVGVSLVIVSLLILKIAFEGAEPWLGSLILPSSMLTLGFSLIWLPFIYKSMVSFIGDRVVINRRICALFVPIFSTAIVHVAAVLVSLEELSEKVVISTSPYSVTVAAIVVYMVIPLIGKKNC